MKEPLVSIIIPIFNGEKYIPEIINNLDNLHYKNFEAIFVNDGSTDDTKKILSNFNKTYIKYIEQENSGVSVARNKGLQVSLGEFIFFVDVDDLIHNDILNIFIEEMSTNNCDVLFCDSSSILEKINTGSYEIDIYNRNSALRDFILRKIHTGVCGLFVKKKLLDEYNLSFKEGFAYSEDLHMVLRIFNSTNKIIHIKLPLYVYKKNDGSAMTKINDKRLDSIYLMKDLEFYFVKTNETFSPFFLKYGVSRTSWALLWQVVRYCDYDTFMKFLKKYDFNSDMKKLLTFPNIKVKVSSFIFIVSKRLYYCIVKIITKGYRIN